MTASVKYVMRGVFPLLILSTLMKGESVPSAYVQWCHLGDHALMFHQALTFRLLNQCVGQGSVQAQSWHALCSITSHLPVRDLLGLVRRLNR
jgi:hypothetical protein